LIRRPSFTPTDCAFLCQKRVFCGCTGRGGSKRRFGVRMRGSGFLAFLCKFSGFSISGPGSAGSRRWSGGRAGWDSRLLVHFCAISGGLRLRWKERNVGLTADAAGLEARATGVHFCANFRVFRRLGPKLPVYPLRLGALCGVRRFRERGPGAVLTGRSAWPAESAAGRWRFGR